MGVRVSRILHAGYVFEAGETRFAFDPIFENPFSHNCFSFPEVRFDHAAIKQQRFDAVFISHYHDDHWSLESLNLLDRRTPIYAFSVFDELFEMTRQLGFEYVHPLVLGEPVHLGGFKITPLRALDSEVDSIFHVHYCDLNILNVVDAWIDPKMFQSLKKGGPWDLILWPFQTMREVEVLSPKRLAAAPAEIPFEWKEQLRELKPRFLVPSSCQFQMEDWSWYNQAFFPISYAHFTREIGALLAGEKTPTEILRLDPGVSYLLEKDSFTPGERLPWIEPVGEANADYDFQPQAQIPATREIARHFRALTADERDRVLDYCRKGLPQKYAALGESAEAYFHCPRLWSLALYDHDGRETEFRFRLDVGEMVAVLATSGPAEWRTEIPMAKLLGALEDGEALTSLYIRINDVEFNDSIETALAEVDPLEDPLIRCLYTVPFGAYQAAQLRRIQLRDPRGKID